MGHQTISSEVRSHNQADVGPIDSVYVLAELSGQSCPRLLRSCLETVLSTSTTVDNYLWVDTCNLPTIAEASENCILNSLEQLMREAVRRGRGFVRAALLSLEANRQVLALCSSSKSTDETTVCNLVNQLAIEYSIATGSRLITVPANAAFRARTPIVPYTWCERWNVSFGEQLEFFERLVTAHCIISWLISGLDSVEVDVRPFTINRMGAERLVPLTFDLSGDPSLAIVFDRVRQTLAARQSRRTFTPIRSGLIHSRVAEYSFLVNQLRISVLAVSRTGQWRAKTELIEDRSSAIVTVSSDLLDCETMGDLFLQIDRCLRETPSMLAEQVSLGPSAWWTANTSGSENRGKWLRQSEHNPGVL